MSWNCLLLSSPSPVPLCLQGGVRQGEHAQSVLHSCLLPELSWRMPRDSGAQYRHMGGPFLVQRGPFLHKDLKTNLIGIGLRLTFPLLVESTEKCVILQIIGQCRTRATQLPRDMKDLCHLSQPKQQPRAVTGGAGEASAGHWGHTG